MEAIKAQLPKNAIRIVQINDMKPTPLKVIATTLALRLRPKQGLVRLRSKREAHESHLMFPKVQKNVRE